MSKRVTSVDHYQTVVSHHQNGGLKPVYFLYGKEEFYIDRLVDNFSSILAPHEKDFNFDLLYGQDVTPAKVLGIARSFPMMAERRVLIVRNFLQTSRGASGEGDLNDFIPYLEQPNPSSVMVLVDTSKPAGNTKFGKAIAKNSNVGFFNFEPMPDYMIPDWIIKWVDSNHQKTIQPLAAQLLSQFVGNNLQLLSSEIDKVCTFVDTKKEVTEADVKKIIGSYREYSAIELKEAIIRQDLDKALFISEQILQHSKSDTGELIRLVGFFYSVFVNIWQIRRLAEKGMSKAQVQSKMGMNTWYFERLWKDAANFNFIDMPRIFEALLDADKSIKGFSTLDTTSILFLLVKRLIG